MRLRSRRWTSSSTRSGRADETGAVVVVLGLRRRTPVGKLLVGSVAQRVILDARCPVSAVEPG